jgi:hypothetical protein
LAIQPDNKILVTGDLTTFNGDSINKMVRLMPDGTIDSTFKADKIWSRAKQIIVQPEIRYL